MTVDEAINAALRHLHQEEVVEVTRRLIQIPSVNPPGGEKPVAEALAGLLESEGIRCTLQEVKPDRPNLTASIGSGGSPHLVLSGHIDVVGAGNLANWTTDPFSREVRDGRIMGRGACDMKGGVAAQACAFLAVHRARLPLEGTLTYSAVMGEETGSEGTEWLLDQGFKADAAIVGECSTAQQIGIGYRGAAWFEITTRGRTSHGSRPHLGNNAILQMTDLVIPTVRDTVARLPYADHPEFLIPRPTLNIGTIQGGFKINVVADSCTASFDVRLVPGQSSEAALSAVRAALTAAQERAPELDWELKIVKQVEPFITDTSSKLMEDLKSAVVSVVGTQPKLIGKTGYSDANPYAHRLGIPAVAFGPGVIGVGHCPDEWVEITDLYQVAQIYTAAAVRFCCVRAA